MDAHHRSGWFVPTGLLALAFIPIIAGMIRLSSLASGSVVTPDSARFVEAPLPVALHILSVSIYCLLGAFQFAPGLRRRRLDRHRAAGRILVVSGSVAALSGLWMAMFYAIVPVDNALLHGFRLFFGSAMVLSIWLGYRAIRRKDVVRHQNWMCRAYAIGLGAGTQALTQLPPLLLSGAPDEMTLALMMGAAWMANLMIAELFIHRRHSNATTGANFDQ